MRAFKVADNRIFRAALYFNGLTPSFFFSFSYNNGIKQMHMPNHWQTSYDHFLEVKNYIKTAV